MIYSKAGRTQTPLTHTRTHTHTHTYTGCPGGDVPDFGRVFPKLKYTDITNNTYIRS